MKFLVIALIIATANAATFSITPARLARPTLVEPVKPLLLTQTIKSVSAEYPIQHAEKDVAIPILKSTAEVTGAGFNWAYEGANGIAAHEEGVLKKFEDKEAIAVKGGYQYVSPDGTPVNVVYIADENGFQPQGDHIPVGPPIPEAIARSLKYIADHPELAAKNL